MRGLALHWCGIGVVLTAMGSLQSLKKMTQTCHSPRINPKFGKKSKRTRRETQVKIEQTADNIIAKFADD
jgi:hypothetical protein